MRRGHGQDLVGAVELERRAGSGQVLERLERLRVPLAPQQALVQVVEIDNARLASRSRRSPRTRKKERKKGRLS